MPSEEEKRPERPSFTRGPPKEKEAEDTGFARGNFAAKKADDGPPKRQPKAPAASAGGDSGFGFRSNNAGRGKGPAKK
jgi:hypothetical protein